MSVASNAPPDWEHLLTASAWLQKILPNAVLVGGTAAALHAGHRMSNDADHVPTDLRDHFDGILAQLESVAGWKTSRVNPPVLILGSLDGIETGVRQLIRDEPLETVEMDMNGQSITIPTEHEVLRIKAVLILKRNAVRDYLDFAALGSRMASEDRIQAMRSFDSLYPQDSGQSALQQLLAQLSTPAPFDLNEMDPEDYRGLVPEMSDWTSVERICTELANDLFEDLCAVPSKMQLDM